MVVVPAGGGGAMDGAVFTDDGFVADVGVAGRAAPLEVLGPVADDGVGVDQAALAEACTLADVGVGPDARAGADVDVFFDDGVGADVRTWVDLRGGIHDGSRMNRHGGIVKSGQTGSKRRGTRLTFGRRPRSARRPGSDSRPWCEGGGSSGYGV